MAIKLLIVEDSALDAELIKRELVDMQDDFEIKVVADKSEFEKILVSWNPDLIISDYDLQVFSGKDVLVTAKALRPNIPIIILSGGISRKQEIIMLENRANDVLTKDNLKRLPYAISRILREQKDKERLNSTLYELAGNLDFQEALSEISLIFNSQNGFEEKMNEALKVLGQIANVSRVYVFEDFDEGKKAKNTFEWCAENVEPQIDLLEDLIYDRDVPSWKSIFAEGGCIQTSDIHTLPNDIVKILEPQDIKALIVYPLHVKGDYFGFIGFDETRVQREWSESEDKLLKSTSGIIANAYVRYQLDQKLRKSNDRLSKLLEEKEILVSEVHHRVKNNLALISSFLQLDQMGMGVKEEKDIVSANILRIKSIAVIHEIIYELGNFSNLSVKETLERVLKESFMQERISDVNVSVTCYEDDIKFNINQAVPFSLLISELIFEAFRVVEEKSYKPQEELKAEIKQDEVNISVNLYDKDLTRVTDLLLADNELNFSEIFNVLAKQLGASIEVDTKAEAIKIEFSYRDVKGSSSALVN